MLPSAIAGGEHGAKAVCMLHDKLIDTHDMAGRAHKRCPLPLQVKSMAPKGVPMCVPSNVAYTAETSVAASGHAV